MKSSQLMTTKTVCVCVCGCEDGVILTLNLHPAVPPHSTPPHPLTPRTPDSSIGLHSRPVTTCFHRLFYTVSQLPLNTRFFRSTSDPFQFPFHFTQMHWCITLQPPAPAAPFPPLSVISWCIVCTSAGGCQRIGFPDLVTL